MILSKSLIILFIMFLSAITPRTGYANVITEKEDEWKEMHFRAVKVDGELCHYIVSSELNAVDPFEGLGRYGGHNLFDNDNATAWVEGVKGHGIGEYIIIKCRKGFPEEVRIASGYQKSPRLFTMNSRPKTVKCTLLGGFFLEGDESEIASKYRVMQISGPVIIELDDEMGEQSFSELFDSQKSLAARDSLLVVFKNDFAEEITERKKFCPTCDMTPQFSFFIKMEITDVYEGSEWDDTCISGIKTIQVPGIETKKILKPNDKILEVYEDEEVDAGRIYFDIEGRKGLLLVDKREMKEYGKLDSDTHMSITLMDVSPDNEWAQVNIMFYEEGAGRVEEYSSLYYVREQKRVDDELMPVIYGVFGFVEEDGKVWLDTADGLVDLEEIREAMRGER